VHLSIGSRQSPLPQRIFGRDLFRYLEATRLMTTSVESRIGRRLRERDVLIGSSPRTARRRYGIRLHGRTEGIAGSEVRFRDGSRFEPRTVIWATGFEPDHSWIDAAIFDDADKVAHRRGVTSSPGLYFLGLPWQYTRGSALLGWVKEDAEHIAGEIARAAGSTTRDRPPIATSSA
jgi:putative flavoprotein involved in K+ transport